jgi:hypothetical protein
MLLIFDKRSILSHVGLSISAEALPARLCASNSTHSVLTYTCFARFHHHHHRLVVSCRIHRGRHLHTLLTSMHPYH